MRAVSNWFFTKYDRYSRPVMTGVFYDGAHTSRQSMQDYINGLGVFYVTRTTGDIGYTHDAGFTVFLNNIWTINYYDDYDFDNNGSSDADWAFIPETEFSSTPHDDLTNYPYYWVSGHAPFFRIKDKITKTKVQQLGIFKGIYPAGEYSICPTEPQTLYYQGNPIKLKSGFHTNPAQTVYIGGDHAPANFELKWLETVNYYDTTHRVIQIQSTNHLDGKDVLSSQYDFSGKVLRTKLTHMKGSTSSQYPQVTVAQRFVYDNAGRLIKSYQQNNTDAEVLVSKLEYNELGQLMTKKLHSTNGGTTFLQSLDFRYNERGWLASVNNPYNFDDAGAISNDLFAYKLLYNSAADGFGVNPQYNGNISGMVWVSQDKGTNGYNFYYDALSRLEIAHYRTYFSGTTWSGLLLPYHENITYDLNGNIKTLLRFSSTGTLMDVLSYGYATDIGNRLDKVEDAVATNSGFDFTELSESPTGSEYEYDDNGNMTKDKNKGISVAYNAMNLPTSISWDANPNKRIELLYSAAGSKLRMTTYNTSGIITDQRNYIGGFEYKAASNPPLQQFAMSEGRVVPGSAAGSFDYEYFLKDHLGNVRVTFMKGTDNLASKIQDNFYYPFGLRINNGIEAGIGNKYLYNGKEIVGDDLGLSWYDYGARWYDPQLGRWHVLDPVDELYSPYCFVGNNPVRFIDPNGMWIDDYYYDNSGKQIGFVPKVQNDRFFIEDFEGEINYGGSAFSEICLDMEIGIFARLVYGEASGNNLASKSAVANVVQNRVESSRFPDTYIGVIEQKIKGRYQFSAVNPKEEKNYWRYSDPTSTTNALEKKSFANSMSVAIGVYNRSLPDATSGSLLYFSPVKGEIPNGAKNWNYDILKEVFPQGVSKNQFRFFKYK
jgi:RHS repeat-associated protein